MKYQRLGGTDLVVSATGFALEALSTPGPVVVQKGQAARLLQESRDLGVTFFDTADRDGEGYGEELLGTALHSHRHDVVIATKVGYDFYTPILDPTRDRRDFPQSFAPAYIRSACERSLRRLRRDYIDLYQIHHPTPETLVDDYLWELLETLVGEGKVRYVGVALGPGPEALAGWPDRPGEGACRRPPAFVQHPPSEPGSRAVPRGRRPGRGRGRAGPPCDRPPRRLRAASA